MERKLCMAGKDYLEHLQRCSVWNTAKIFFSSKFSYLLFCNDTHKTETGTANRWGTTNRQPPGPIIVIGQSETLSSSRIIFIKLFCARAHRWSAFYLSATTNFEIMPTFTLHLICKDYCLRSFGVRCY
jgi:hypothetical protein